MSVVPTERELFPPTRRARTPALWIATLLIALGAGLVLPHIRMSAWGSANSKSRYATVESLVDHGTFVIDASPYKATMDRVKIDGKLYSSKPPLLSVLTAGVYFVTQQVTGWTIQKNEHAVIFTCNLLTVFALHLVLLVYFFRFVRLLVADDLSALVALAAAAFSFLGAGYAVDLNNHSPSATLGLVAFYYAYRARHGSPTPGRHLALSGLCAGMLPGIDLPSGAISAAVGVYLLTWDWKQTLRWFVPFTLPGVTLHLFLTWLSSGSVLPVYLREELYEYETAPRHEDPLPVYSFHMLFGHHGIFSMTPVLVLGLLALVDVVRRRSPELMKEALVVVGAGIPLFIFYVAKTHNYGGVCVGFRWAIAYAPLLLLFFGVWIDRWRNARWAWIVVVAALVVGQFHVNNALQNPWQNSRWHLWMTSPGKK